MDPEVKVHTAKDGPMDLRYQYDEWEMDIDRAVDAMHSDKDGGPAQAGGSKGQHCALPEPETRDDPRVRLLCQSIGVAQVEILKELNVFDSVVAALPMPSSSLIMTSEEDPKVLAMDNFVETDILLTLDSGCCDHICDLSDAPGYSGVLTPSSGLQRGQRFVVGSGERVPNRGQVKLRMRSKDSDGLLMSSVFQVAEITRPLMSFSKICDQGLTCIFGKTHSRVVDTSGNVVAKFDRDGGLYTCTMTLRRPEALDVGNGSSQGFTRQDA